MNIRKIKLRPPNSNQTTPCLNDYMLNRDHDEDEHLTSSSSSTADSNNSMHNFHSSGQVQHAVVLIQRKVKLWESASICLYGGEEHRVLKYSQVLSNSMSRTKLSFA